MNSIKGLVKLFIAFMLVFGLFACGSQSEPVALEVDHTSTEGDLFIDEFDMEDVRLILTMDDGSEKVLYLDESMMSNEDALKLKTTGIHEITVFYEDFIVDVTLRLVNDLTVRLMAIYDLAREADAFEGTYEEWLESVRGPRGEDGREVVLRVSNDYIQWQYEGDEGWANLIAIVSLIGSQGEPGEDGKDGREIVMQVQDDHIQWKYENDETWQDLISLERIRGIDENESLLTDGLVFSKTTYDGGKIGYIVSDYRGIDRDVVVPEMFQNRRVVGIGNIAFAESFIETIHIPASVTSIGRYAFRDARSLTTVAFEEGGQLERIGHHAFYGAGSLTSVHISESVTDIGLNAFASAGSLTIYTEFEEKPTGWDGDWNSSNRFVFWDVQGYDELEDFAYAITQEDEVIIRGLSKDSDATDLIIPETIEDLPVTTIQAYAFKNQDHIKSIYIPDSVLIIGEHVFQGADSVTIDVQATEKPEGWHEDWNPDGRPVNWEPTSGSEVEELPAFPLFLEAENATLRIHTHYSVAEPFTEELHTIKVTESATERTLHFDGTQEGPPMWTYLIEDEESSLWYSSYFIDYDPDTNTYTEFGWTSPTEENTVLQLYQDELEAIRLDAYDARWFLEFATGEYVLSEAYYEDMLDLLGKDSVSNDIEMFEIHKNKEDITIAFTIYDGLTEMSVTTIYALESLGGTHVSPPELPK